MTKLTPTEQSKILKAFQNLTGHEANLIWDILSAHQENEICNGEFGFSDDEEKYGSVEETPDFKVGQALLERIETALVEGV
jgi:hypothetical protein